MLGHRLSPMSPTLSRSNTERCRSTAVVPPEAVANFENESIVPTSRRVSLQRIRTMTTSRIKNAFHAPHGHHLFRSNSSSLINEKPIDEEQKKKEKDFISCYDCNGPTLSPAQIAEAPRSKELGIASKQFRITDFELIKTIGTGILSYTCLSMCRNLTLTWYRLGTFARVWLSCLKGAPKEGPSQKVFALKILRKVDSTYCLPYTSSQEWR